MIKIFHKPLFYRMNSLKPLFKVLIKKKKLLPMFLSSRRARSNLHDRRTLEIEKVR
jgi:hypothetical protein